MTEKEFDRFAPDYSSILERHTRIGGEETEYYARYKVETVHDILTSRHSSSPTSILDFGCGVGQSIPFFSRLFPQSRILGVDVSPDSIAAARMEHGSKAEFACSSEDMHLDLRDGSFDLAFTACVLHHIPHVDHPKVLRDLWRVLKPGGRLFVFEHNPLNPLTVKVVRACPFDENAVLIRPAAMRDRLSAAGFGNVEVGFCLFVPGWLGPLKFIEPALRRCPLGAQYYAIGTKSLAQ